MLTAAIRDLHRAYPEKYKTTLSTGCPELWQNNPYNTGSAKRKDTIYIEADYPLIHETKKSVFNCNKHFIEAFHSSLSETLKIDIPLTEMKGDLYLSTEEKKEIEELNKKYKDKKVILLSPGGKTDFTCKIWPQEYYTDLIRRHPDEDVIFILTGRNNHPHFIQPDINIECFKNVIDLRGKTNIRQFITLMCIADLVISHVSFAMHLSAAVSNGLNVRHKLLPCIVIAGGRENPYWGRYPWHSFLHTVGSNMECCKDNACWQCRVEKIGDGAPHDGDICRYPVHVEGHKTRPLCMNRVTPEIVSNQIDLFL